MNEVRCDYLDLVFFLCVARQSSLSALHHIHRKK